MIEDFLYILVEWGIIREDFVHRRKIKKQEQADGKKYPIRKYLLTPSLKLFFGLLVLVSILSITLSIYRSKVVYPRETMEEMILIQKSANNWKMRNGIYPDKIEDLIGGRPYRKTWPVDAWGTSYLTEIIAGKFEISSAGPD